MLDWLSDNWFTLLLLFLVILLAAGLLRAAGGVASTWRILADLLSRLWPGGGGFERTYLQTLREREAMLPALISGENLRTLSLIRAFALLRLIVPGVDDDLDGQRTRPDEPERMLRPDSSLPGRIARWWRERRECSSPPNSPGGAIWANPRLLMLGGPGSGKTTLLRHIALICAAEQSGRASLTQENRVRDIYGWPRPLFPIFIPLRGIIRHCPDWQERSLLDAFEQALGQILDLNLSKRCRSGWFTRRLVGGNCLVLIDGFDELRDESARDIMADRIRELGRLSRNGNNYIVVSSRPIGYDGQLDQDFARRDLAPLNRSEIDALIRARYNAIHEQKRPPDWQPEERATNLSARLVRSASLLELSRAPLLLSLIIGIDYAQESGELPGERYRVYELALEYLIERWELQRGRDARAHDRSAALPKGRTRLNLDEKMRMAAELAWAMFNRPVEQQMQQIAVREQADPYLLIRRRDAQAILAESLRVILTERGLPAGPALDRQCREEAAHWLRDLGTRGGLLQGESDDESPDAPIQFAHKSLQEYLAAHAVNSLVTCSPDRRHEHGLLKNWQNDDWHEIIRFYAAGYSARPVVEFLLAQNLPQANLLAGWCLYERPRNPPDVAVRRRLSALFDAPAEVLDARAGEQLHTMLEALDATPNLDSDRDRIESALTQAAAPLLRRRACELLAPLVSTETAVRDHLFALFNQDTDYRVRIAAAEAIAACDPRFAGDGWISELVEVPAGPFRMGSSDEDTQTRSDEKPQHELGLPTYWIGKYPVTVAQWRRFAESGAYAQEEYWTRAGWEFVSGIMEEARYQKRRRWDLLSRKHLRRPLMPVQWRDPGPEANNLPVVRVSWFESVAYCRWLSKQTGRMFQLPTEAEWEKAARGTEGLIWPWGNMWEAGYCNSEELGLGRATPVGSFPNGVSPYGIHDLAGNVFEWCATRSGKSKPYDVAEDEWDDTYLSGDIERRMRGGTYFLDQRVARGASRHYGLPRYRLNKIGVRVASHSPVPGSES